MISKKEVQHIAKLARIDFSEKELNKLSQQLSSILDYVEKLKSCDTSKVEPLAQVTGLENVMREDQAKTQDSRLKTQKLDLAPKKKDGYVKVKAVL